MKKIYWIVEAAVLAALYIVLTMMVAPIAAGPIQFRVSEALMLIPAVTASAVYALPLGVFLSNVLLGLGWVDMVFGTLASLLACVFTRLLAKRMGILPAQVKWTAKDLWAKKKPALFLLLIPSVLFNALIVGSYLPIYFPELRQAGQALLGGILISIFQIAISELVVVALVGIPLFLGVYPYFRGRNKKSN